MDAIARSPLVAADVAVRLFGGIGNALIAALVCVSTFGTMNGGTMCYPRIFYAMAEDRLFFRGIAAVHPRYGTPHAAIALTAALSVGFLWVRTFEQLIEIFILGVLPFWALGASAVIVMRRRRPETPRPYRTPGLPAGADPVHRRDRGPPAQLPVPAARAHPCELRRDSGRRAGLLSLAQAVSDPETALIGCLLGQALGDALGFVVEARPPAVACEYVERYLLAGRAGELAHPDFPFGQYSDDTQLARELLVSYADAGGWSPEAYAGRLAALFGEGRDVGAGPGTRAAAMRLLGGAHWSRSGTPAPYAGNGSAMRAAPLGLLFGEDTPSMVEATVEQSLMTHLDPRCSAGALAVAGAVSFAARRAPIRSEEFLGGARRPHRADRSVRRRGDPRSRPLGAPRPRGCRAPPARRAARSLICRRVARNLCLRDAERGVEPLCLPALAGRLLDRPCAPRSESAAIPIRWRRSPAPSPAPGWASTRCPPGSSSGSTTGAGGGAMR